MVVLVKVAGTGGNSRHIKDYDNNNFGNITAAESARVGQLGLKLYF